MILKGRQDPRFITEAQKPGLTFPSLRKAQEPGFMDGRVHCADLGGGGVAAAHLGPSGGHARS